MNAQLREELDFRPESAYSMCSTEHRAKLREENLVAQLEEMEAIEAGKLVLRYKIPAYNNFDALDGERLIVETFSDEWDLAEALDSLEEAAYENGEDVRDVDVRGTLRAYSVVSHHGRVEVFTSRLRFAYVSPEKVTNAHRFGSKIAERRRINLDFWKLTGTIKRR